MTKVNKQIDLIRNFQGVITRSSLHKLYKAFIRPHSDYGDIIFDQAFNIAAPFV